MEYQTPFHRDFFSLLSQLTSIQGCTDHTSCDKADVILEVPCEDPNVDIFLVFHMVVQRLLSYAIWARYGKPFDIRLLAHESPVIRKIYNVMLVEIFTIPSCKIEGVY